MTLALTFPAMGLLQAAHAPLMLVSTPLADMSFTRFPSTESRSSSSGLN